VLIEAGADIDAVSAPDSGGVPSGTALDHAAVFGMTEVVDVLVAAGAKIHSLEMAAVAGDVTGWPLARFTHQSRLRALVFAADHQRLNVIDRLVEAGTPVNEADAEWERLPLHTAAGNGRAASVRRLLDPLQTPPPAPAKKAPDRNLFPERWGLERLDAFPVGVPSACH
jgi:ankyrin repeat protein